MTIESSVAGVVESTAASAVTSVAESAASSVASSAVSSVAGGFLSSLIPGVGTVKLVMYAALAAALAYGAYRVVAYVDQAAEDHAARLELTSELNTAVSAFATEKATLDSEKAKTEAQAAQIVAFTTADAIRTAATNTKVEAIRHALPTPGCTPSAALLNGLSGLR